MPGIWTSRGSCSTARRGGVAADGVDASVSGPRQQSKANQHNSLRSRWSSSTSARISSGSWARCHWHSKRPASSARLHCGRPHGLDRVGGGTEFVGRHMAHARSLAGSVRGMSRRPTQISRRGICMACRRARFRPRDLAPSPRTP